MTLLALPTLDPVATLISCLSNRHDLVSYTGDAPTSWSITLMANPTEVAQRSPTPTFATKHQELGWLSMMNVVRPALQACAALGVAWDVPVFGVKVTLTARKNDAFSLTADSLWMSERPLDQPWEPHMKDASSQALFLDRARALQAGPTGTQRWEVRGNVRQRHSTILAGSAAEAVRAYTLLAHGMITDDAGDLITASVAVEEVVSTFTPFLHTRVNTADAWMEGDAFDDLFAPLKAAQASARQAVKRWSVTDDAFGTAVLNARTVFEDAEGLARFAVNTPARCTAEWTIDGQGDGFDEDFAHDARLNLTAFARDFLALPGLVGTPTSLDLYINAIPGGDALLGLGLGRYTRFHHDDAEPRPILQETEWPGFCRGWKPRLAKLLALPKPTGLFRIHTHAHQKNATIVSAADPASAVEAYGLLWRDEHPFMVHRVTRLTTFSELGYQGPHFEDT